MINILFVCSGGTCRSAMAKAIMQDMIKRKNLKGVTSRSAGLFVTNETAMNEKAKVALRQLSVRVPRHKATQLNEEMLEKAYSYPQKVLSMKEKCIISAEKYTPNVAIRILEAHL